MAMSIEGKRPITYGSNLVPSTCATGKEERNTEPHAQVVHACSRIWQRKGRACAVFSDRVSIIGMGGSPAGDAADEGRHSKESPDRAVGRLAVLNARFEGCVDSELPERGDPEGLDALRKVGRRRLFVAGLHSHALGQKAGERVGHRGGPLLRAHGYELRRRGRLLRLGLRGGALRSLPVRWCRLGPGIEVQYRREILAPPRRAPGRHDWARVRLPHGVLGGGGRRRRGV
mmetsp:Transcript_56805/g.128742  ORF Transcript_56805/g.128742 Transcript_56805/m.128742 type:complete len:230 (-) Transcript_56805:189-878(-)